MIRLIAPAAALGALLACGGSPQPVPAEPAKVPEAPAADPHAGHGAAGDVGAFTPLSGEGQRVFFVSPADGANVKSPLHVVFGAEGVAIIPAGDPKPASGHHHIILDGAPVPAGEGVPKDERHIHYGNGQTEADLTLPVGTHTLTMQLADFAHRSYGPTFSATITVTVTE